MREGGEIRFGLGLCLSSARSVCVSYSHEGRQAERPKLTLRNSATLTHRKAEFTPACIPHVYYYNIQVTNMNDGCGEAGCRVGKGQGKGHELHRGSAMCHSAMSYFSLRRAGR